MTRFFCLGIAVLLASCGGPAPVEPGADLVLMNGNVLIVDPAAPSVEAVAVRGDRILAVGGTKEIARFISGDTTAEVDLIRTCRA